MQYLATCDSLRTEPVLPVGKMLLYADCTLAEFRLDIGSSTAVMCVVYGLDNSIWTVHAGRLPACG